MKRITILCLLLMFLTIPLFAQVPPKIDLLGGQPITIQIAPAPPGTTPPPSKSVGGNVTIYSPEIGALPFAQTATIVFAWDPMPVGESPAWTLVRIYERTGTTPNFTYTKVAEVTGTLTTATITGVSIGAHTYIARSYNAAFESDNSNTVSVPMQPSAPATVRITITIVVTP